MNSLINALKSRSHFRPIKLSTRLLATEPQEKIEIPKRIPRGPTDILLALESTIKRDPTAAHYKYHDDPFLIPASNAGKRTFSMAKESGRKAALWVRQEHKELFQHQEADPPIKAFMPTMVYNEESEVTEEDLQNVIRNALVEDSALIYRLLKKKGVDLSGETTQSLLELLCYSNSTQMLPEEFLEERWFRQTGVVKEKVRKTWKDGDLAEEVFIGIENPPAEAYSAIIQGMCKYYQAERAFQLFEEAQGKGIPLPVGVYNSIINVSNFLKETYDSRWLFVNDLLLKMNLNKVRPNLGTLNAVLETLSMMRTFAKSKDFMLRTLTEFRQLGIEPSLTSWYHLLVAFYKERGPTSTILSDIMNELENKDLQIQDVKDTYFFMNAMAVCRNHLNDKDLAKRVDKLLHHGHNYNLIGDSYKESVYYRHYFCLLCATEPFDEFMETYKLLVPHIYVPEPGVMAEVLKVVEMDGAIKYLPKLWSDMVIFDHLERDTLITQVLDILVKNDPEGDPEMKEKFAKMAWEVYSKIEGQSEARIHKLAFTGEMIGNIMIVLLRNKEFQKATEVFEKLEKNQHSIAGVPKFEALSLYVDQCIEEKVPSIAINCIQYCAESGFSEAASLAVKLDQALTLDERYLERLAKIVGDNVLKNSESIGRNTGR